MPETQLIGPTRVDSDARDLVFTRTFAAPRELVFRAWTEPAHLIRWWGPKIMGNRCDRFELRPGGALRIVMLGEDGAEYPINGRFLEVAPPERLVMTMDTDDHPPEWHAMFEGLDTSGEIVTAVDFETAGAGTRITVKQTFPTTELRAAHQRLGNPVGWSESFEKLDALLAAA